MPYLTDDQIQQYKERYELIEVEYNDLVVRTEKTFKVSLVCLFVSRHLFLSNVDHWRDFLSALPLG